MILAFLNIGTPEILLILIGFALIIAVGNYGKDTPLGYYGSVLLSLFITPVLAFFIITFFKVRKSS